ncbi:hypothetical protein [Streptomyces silvisoli]|uniref:Uncharacterized protein n=1 Tax=Streptomyces silvisoli TaxID=3034235 RepID=A0ABT5ZTT5_9ACTN|nr:hypothetical protein [Streptomyces silvisoli]MDF3293061.1 hypothetical protein [Streptomyces silvisoli]
MSAHHATFAHATRSGDTHWSITKVHFPSGHYTLRTSCVGNGSVTATATGSPPWNVQCVTGQISVDEVTQPSGDQPVDFSFTTTAGVRFAVVAIG